MYTQVLSYGKGDRTFGHSPRGPVPLNMGILGSATEQKGIGRPVLDTGGTESPSDSPTSPCLPGIQISWLPAELCLAGAGSCGLSQVQVSHDTSYQESQSATWHVNVWRLPRWKCHLAETYRVSQQREKDDSDPDEGTA